MQALYHIALCLVTSATISSAQFSFGGRTCLSNCGSTPSISERLVGVCSCSESCEVTGNCCRDYWRYCSKSCKRRCGEPYHPLKGCQCHDGCEGSGCCKDFQKICVEGIEDEEETTTEAPRISLPPVPSTTPWPIERGFSYLSEREIECPKGIAFVSCPTNPCDEPCEKHPDARCLVNQCGTCEAKYFDSVGNELNCYDPEKYCPDGQRIFDCGEVDLCAGTSCPGFPRAICVPNKCGGCYYDFVDEKGNIVDCEIASSPSPCGEGIEMMQCSPPPCAGQVCEADITARCRNVMCGECKAEFYDIRGNIVDCTAREPAVCEDECRRDPCSATTCHAHPKAQCMPKKTSRCGDCEAKFILEGRTLRDIDCAIPNACQEKAKTCDRNPCQMYTCPGHDVICIAQYCNGCNALFFNKEGKRLRQQDCFDISTLDLPICPNGRPADICSADLCLGQRCGADHTPNCKPDECNGCALQFFDDDGNEIDCEDEKEHVYDPPKACPDGKSTAKCPGELCANAACPGHSDAKCKPDGCDECNIRFYDQDMNELECVESEKTTPAPQPRGRCPSGRPLLDCNKDVCEYADCDASPGAFCRANPCDNCKPVFFDKVGRRINCDRNLIGTCDGKCGSARNASAECHCDYGCVKRGDCCSNFREKCETCSERCGKFTPLATCQCTNDCRLKDNCCVDFAFICLADKTCKGRCDSQWNPSEMCQCHPRCVQRDNCCLDYGAECA